MLNDEDKNIIKSMNTILGTNHRSEPYNLISDDDLKQALLFAVAEYRDYCNYEDILSKLAGDFDESLEYYDTASWFHLGYAPEKADALALECVSSLNNASEKFYELTKRAKDRLDIILKVALSAPAATQNAVLGREYNIEPQKIDEWIESLLNMLNETEYYYEMDKNLEALIDLMKEEF